MSPLKPLRSPTLECAIERVGVTQRALAKECDIPEPRVSEMLHGKRRLQAREYRRVQKFLGLTDSELLDIVTAP